MPLFPQFRSKRLNSCPYILKQVPQRFPGVLSIRKPFPGNQNFNFAGHGDFTAIFQLLDLIAISIMSELLPNILSQIQTFI